MKKKNIFSDYATTESNTNYEQSISRINPIYKKNDDIRSEFSRDYNRILHSNAFRRLKHKTQVFYATENDHICTRIEHVYHVESISRTISETLGLNAELATAIALGHDLGHAPFGHQGEKILARISKEKHGKTFWHEQNSLHLVDDIESLPDISGNEQLLNLTYAVRDGIISHCGEIDQPSLFPRNEAIDLKTISEPNQYNPYTWEACVVKIADKIAYLGRDIEDAQRLKILDKKQLSDLEKIITQRYPKTVETLITTSIMHNFIINLCENSSPSNGLCFDNTHFELMKEIKKFNYQNIYSHQRIQRFNKYADVVISTLFDYLLSFSSRGNYCEGSDTELNKSFISWQNEYMSNYLKSTNNKQNNENIYVNNVITYISLMTDRYAIRAFNDIIRF